jgi:hypothetical protein
MYNRLVDVFTRNYRDLGLLITPSWTSGLAVALVSAVAVLGVFGRFIYNSSSLHAMQLQHEQVVSQGYHVVENNVADNNLLANLPLILLWAGVGLLAYGLFIGVFRIYKAAELFKDEVQQYMNIDKRALVRQTVLDAVIRMVTLIVWVLFLQFTLHFIIPYVVAVAYAAGDLQGIGQTTLYLVWGAGILALALHIHVVLIRLFFLRPRLFGYVMLK